MRRRPVADGGVEAEQLHHALAARAPAARRGLAGAARRVVPHQQAQAAARRRVGVGVGVGVGAGAAVVGEDVLEGVHGLAELAVRLRTPSPRPPLPPLVGVLEELEDLELQRGVVAAREAPALGPLDGGEVLAARRAHRRYSRGASQSLASFSMSTACSGVSRAVTDASAARFSHPILYACDSASSCGPCAVTTSSSSGVTLRGRTYTRPNMSDHQISIKAMDVE